VKAIQQVGPVSQADESARARIVEEKPKKMVVQCSLLSEGNECARGEVVAVRVDVAWKR